MLGGGTLLEEVDSGGGYLGVLSLASFCQSLCFLVATRRAASSTMTFYHDASDLLEA
jgi:hypothetical protein